MALRIFFDLEPQFFSTVIEDGLTARAGRYRDAPEFHAATGLDRFLNSGLTGPVSPRGSPMLTLNARNVLVAEKKRSIRRRDQSRRTAIAGPRKI